MLSLAEVGPQDYLVDLGSGDGRIVIAAAKQYGARGLGIDTILYSSPGAAPLRRKQGFRTGRSSSCRIFLRRTFGPPRW
jgi:hypothetical protein